MSKKKKKNKLPQSASPQAPQGIPPRTAPSAVAQQIAQTMTKVHVSGIQMSGPLPPPELLTKYNDAVPGAADRIITMAEEQQRHTHKMQEIDLTEAAADLKRGKHIGVVVVALAFIVCGYAIYEGAFDVARWVGTTTVLGLVGAYVLGKIPNILPFNKKEPDGQ